MNNRKALDNPAKKEKSCTSKKRFSTKKEAARQLGKYAYHCDYCDGWHRATPFAEKTEQQRSLWRERRGRKKKRNKKTPTSPSSVQEGLRQAEREARWSDVITIAPEQADTEERGDGEFSDIQDYLDGTKS